MIAAAVICGAFTAVSAVMALSALAGYAGAVPSQKSLLALFAVLWTATSGAFAVLTIYALGLALQAAMVPR